MLITKIGRLRMLIPIEKNLQFYLKEPLEIEKTPSQSSKIEATRNEFIPGREGKYYNGEIFTVTNIEETTTSYLIEIGKAKYADLIYATKNQDLLIWSLYAAIIFQTKDNYYLLIRNNHKELSFIGGMASEEDFQEQTFSPTFCLKRELKEELGIDLNNKEIVPDYKISYLKVPGDNKLTYHSFGIIFTGSLNYTKEELQSYFEANKEYFDHEITELYFYSKENALEFKKMRKKSPVLTEWMNSRNEG